MCGDPLTPTLGREEFVSAIYATFVRASKHTKCLKCAGSYNFLMNAELLMRDFAYFLRMTNYCVRMPIDSAVGDSEDDDVASSGYVDVPSTSSAAVCHFCCSKKTANNKVLD